MKLCKQDNLTRHDDLYYGGEPDHIYLIRQHILVPDDYDFITNGHTEVDTIEGWAEFGPHLVGHYQNFMDWKCCRDKIKAAIFAKAGNDYANYITNLTAIEKEIATFYCPTIIVGLLGYPQLVIDCGGEAQAAASFDTYLSYAQEARVQRYHSMVSYVFKRLGKFTGLKAEEIVRQNHLKSKYIERGVLTEFEDGVPGIEDCFNSEG